MNLRPLLRVLPLSLLLFVFIAQFATVAQAAAPLRRPISPRQPMWLVHIDTWNYADPQKIIDLIPADIRPFVVMNISLSISHDEATSQFQVAEYGYEIAKSWLRACAQNRMWAMVQPSSGGYSQFSDADLSVYEEFYRDYPNLIGFNYCEQFWGFDSATDPLSPAWADRINHFANLLALSNRHGGYLVVSWCGNQWSPNINPIAMLKRVPAFAAACRTYTENYILCEKYTQQSYQSDMESLTLGAYLSGYSGNYGMRYDDTGWTDSTGAHANFTMATQGAPFLEHVMLTGQTVFDGPELIWTQCFREISAGSTTDGYSMRRWETFSQFDNVSVDLFRKVLDGTVRIPTRREVIDRTKVVAIANVNSGTSDAQYSSLETLFEGLYRMDGDGNLRNNKSFFKKTGRYPTIPTVYQLDDADAQSFAVQVNHSAAATRWPTLAAKTAEFDGLFPEEYTGDIYAGRHENGWVVYNPYKTGQTASGSVPFKYNTCDRMELTLSQYTAGVVKEYAGQVTYYLTNYDNVLDTGLKTDVIAIHGATSEPTWSFADRGSHQASVVTQSWSGGVFTLTVQHNGPLDITVNCSGAAAGRLTAYTSASVAAPSAPPTYVGPLQYEAECFDYKNIDGITKGGNTGDVRNYTGQGYLRFGTVATSAMRDTVTVPAAGVYRLDTRYSFVGADITSVGLYVNGSLVATPTFTQTPTLSDWTVLTQSVTLRAGANTLEYRANATRPTVVHFDNIVVAPTAFTHGAVIQENEDGFLQVDGVIASAETGHTGTGYADTTDAAGASIRWKINSPFETTASFTFRYASTEDRTAALYVEGVNLIPGVLLPSTGSLSTWGLVTVHASVRAGLSGVRLQSVSAGGLPNIDFLGVGGAEVGGSLAPAADTYVRDGNSNVNANFGTSAQLVAKYDSNANSGFNRVSYLKFDVGGLADAQNVKLKLVPFQVDGAATLSYEGISSDAWTETGMTWNNRPTAAGTFLTTFAGYAVGRQIEVDITEAANAEAAGDGTLSLRISNGGGNFIGFHSRESATPAFRPVLEYTVSSITPDSSPIALHLRLDDGAGTTAADSSGRDRNGTLVNSSAWVAGSDAKIDGALKLTGGHVTLPAGIVSGLDDCTVAFWVKLDSINTWARVFDFNNGTTTSSMYFVPRTAGGLVRFGLSGQNLEAPAGVQFATGVWTHVAVTLSGNTTTMYLNGAAVATTTTMTNNPSGLGITPNNFIGKSASTADPALRGTVDDFRIYEIPLGAAEIAALSGSGSSAVSSLNRANVTPSNSAAVNWTLTFDSATTGVTASNFSLSGTATSGASIGTPTTDDSGLTWNIPVTTGPGDGTLQLDMANAIGLGQAISTALPFNGQAYTMDKTAPLITSGATASGDYRNAGFSYTITASGSATAYGASGLPSGLGVDSGSGAITGTPTQAGTFNATITATDAAGNLASAPITITIHAAVLTVTADSKSRVYGAANPVFTTTITGFVGGETASVLSGAASLSTAADAASVPGDYPIAVALGTLAATNYTFSFVNGTLTVTALTYADWKAENFAPGDQANDAISGPEADPDGDGMANLLEHALGGDPLENNRSILPGVGASGGNVLLTFLRPDGPESVLSLTVQSSADLAAWTDHTVGATSGTSNGAIIAVEENGTAPDSITVLIPLDGAARKFVRLQAATN